MTSKDIIEKIKLKFGEIVLESKFDGVVDPYLKIVSSSVKEVAFFLRDDSELSFDYLMCLSGVDYAKGLLGVVYQFYSLKNRHKITIKVEIAAEQPELPSIVSAFPSANWHEREAFDMFGIIFTDHPDLRRILLPDDWVGYPLRKDYNFPEFYNGIKVPY